MNKKKVLSFSLYGENPIYTLGCIRNAELHKTYFNDWEMWVYYNDTVPIDIINKLSELNVKLINTNEDRQLINSMWRFLPICDENVEYFICRDCDSRISERDVVAVDEWISSGKDFHILREHPIGHGWPMNAGMWGGKGDSIKDFKNIMESYITSNYRPHDRSMDQYFLRDVVYNYAVRSVFVHDEYFNFEKCGVKIKRDRHLDDFAFIGESVDEFDVPRGDQRTPIKERYGW
jgi:hypothetical protein